MIEVNHIHVVRGGHSILHRVSLQVRPGEVVAVIGANGAGKSTLLKAMAGEINPINGNITVNGIKLSEWSGESLARTRAILSQQTQLSFAMQVEEVVKLGRYPYAKKETQTNSQKIARHCLRLVGLQHFAGRNILTLSGGEQQRVHFARVLAQLYQKQNQESKYLLLDEPTNSLDIAQQHQLLRMVRDSSREQNFGIFIILHDMNLAAQYADRIILLKNGAIIASGSPEEVFTRFNILKGFNVHADIASAKNGIPLFLTFQQKNCADRPLNIDHQNPWAR